MIASTKDILSRVETIPGIITWSIERRLMSNKIEKQLQFTCSHCFSTFQLQEIHEKESANCSANCPSQWEAILNKHYQDCIVLNLAKEEAQKEEEPN